MLKGDGPFQILERINDNAYKMDLPDKYDVSATFNYFFFFLFDVSDDLRSIPFKNGGDDAI
jgi:hypothetical protein